MSDVLWFECNYLCGDTIGVDMSGFDEILDGTGHTPAATVEAWVGKRVVGALVDHHLRHCTEYYKSDDGRPWLRLVKS